MRKPLDSPAPVKVNDPKAIRWLRWTLLLLVVELVFEGLARKFNIKGTNVAIFLLKDVIVAALGLQLLRLHRPRAIDFLWAAYILEIFLFIPVIFQTAAHDPILAIFGAKQYLLYPLVGFSVFIAFENASIQEIIHFFRWLALLVIPTAVVALIQIRLPPTHWLNLSVTGESLEDFSAGGYLRVSSTFSFVAQYCAFINAEVFITWIALTNLKDVGFFKKIILLSIVPLLLISSYVTGSRGAVLLSFLVIAVAGALSLLKFQVRSAMRVVFIIGGLLVILAAARAAFPDLFAAYSEREQGQLLSASSEMQQRVFDAMFNWIGGIFSTPFLGYGLGIMSNGSETISNYAFVTRAFSWTETDYATTLYEGGLYLVVVWYGFRYFVIYQVLRRFLALGSQELAVPCAVCLGFVIIIGLTETLAIQPPIAIWWWISVGTSLVIWWKSIEPRQNSSSETPPPPKAPAKYRGQSSYAQRLHGEEK